MQPSDYSSPFTRFLFDSPLHTKRGRIVFALITLSVLSLAAHTWIGWLTPLKSGLILLFGLFFALLGSTLGLLLLTYLDRREPEPWAISSGVMLVSTTIATAAAAFFNGLSPVPTLTVGLNEEFWKVSPLLLFVFFAPRVVSGVRDGMIYGAIGGFGFNIMETAVYILRSSYPKLGLLEGTTMQLSRLGWWGIENHVIWSALVGAGIGYAVQKTKPSRFRLAVPVGAYLMAALTHTLQDIGVSAILLVAITLGMAQMFGLDPKNPEQVSQFMPTIMALEALAINVVILPILLYALVRSGDWERSVIRQQLVGEQPTVVTPEELKGIESEQRFGIRRIPGYSKSVGRAIRNAQNNLAFHKQYLKKRGRSSYEEPLADYLRSEVTRLRTHIAA
ncbi:PrsW family glutamic-type intramembrane protease [Pantanalinema rosaneae CENA516]|uniref:PrsW family glutamic-type intramembrane protease n=1 Tax=Pantanalinema rosaneae TaxID=1620701 RepID=UPI003D6DAC12